MEKLNENFFYDSVKKNRYHIRWLLLFLSCVFLTTMIYGLITYDFSKFQSIVYMISFAIGLSSCIITWIIGKRLVSKEVVSRKKLYALTVYFEGCLFVSSLGVSAIYTFEGNFPIFYYLVIYSLPLFMIMKPKEFCIISLSGSIFLGAVFVIHNHKWVPSFYISLAVAALLNVFIVVKAYYTNYAAYKLESELHNQSYKDSLTGLYNRRAFDDRIVNEKDNFFLLIFDCDDFKSINDQFGHEKGDEYLIKISKLIIDRFGEPNCYRMGGDEFIVVSYDDKEFISDKIYEINNEIHKIYKDGGISAGAIFSKDALKEELIRFADQALYEVKNNEKGHIKFK